LTVIEILVVVSIIAILVGILVPALRMVQKTAKGVKQQGQFTAIDLGLAAFRGDYGDYPPSAWNSGSIYAGGQKLTEALLGWDLLGFHPGSAWNWEGKDAAGTLVYNNSPANLSERKGPYLESGTQYAFTLNDLFGSALFTRNGANTYVLCDVFGRTKVAVSGGTAKAGAPILYYKADPSGKTINTIYDDEDNITIIQVKELVDGVTTPFDENAFYDCIRDPKIKAAVWPYNPSSYILISAGADGVYGTGDDIRNFGN